MLFDLIFYYKYDCKPQRCGGTIPAKYYSSLLLYLFYPKNQLVSLGTLLPAAVRGLETCQFLRWANTESLISSVCCPSDSRSLSLSLCLRACVRVCAWWSEKESCAPDIRKEGREWNETGFHPLLFCGMCHNKSQGLHNPAQQQSTHLITNGD